MGTIATTDMDEYEADLTVRCGGRDGFEVVDTPDYGGWAQVRVKTTENATTDAAREWLPESDWLVFEQRGDHAYERAMQAALAYLGERSHEPRDQHRGPQARHAHGPVRDAPGRH